MIELHWDLTQDATRQYLRDNLFVRMSGQQRSQLDAEMAAVTLTGDGHHHAHAHGDVHAHMHEHGESAQEPHYHDVAAINAAIDATALPDRVKEDAKAVYDILVHAEAQVHGTSVDEAHFHEVGNAEAVANVLAICCAVDLLAPERITASAIQTGKGKVQCAHGLLDIPAPATVAIIEAHNLPVCPENQRIEGEWCTPTSAALIAHFVDGFV